MGCGGSGVVVGGSPRPAFPRVPAGRATAPRVRPASAGRRFARGKAGARQDSGDTDPAGGREGPAAPERGRGMARRREGHDGRNSPRRAWRVLHRCGGLLAPRPRRDGSCAGRLSGPLVEAPARVAAVLGQGAENGLRTCCSSRWFGGRSRRCSSSGCPAEIQALGAQSPRRAELRARGGGSRDRGLPKLGWPRVRRPGAPELLAAGSARSGRLGRAPLQPGGGAPLGLQRRTSGAPCIVVVRGRGSAKAAVHVRTAGAARGLAGVRGGFGGPSSSRRGESSNARRCLAAPLARAAEHGPDATWWGEVSWCAEGLVAHPPGPSRPARPGRRDAAASGSPSLAHLPPPPGVACTRDIACPPAPVWRLRALASAVLTASPPGLDQLGASAAGWAQLRSARRLQREHSRPRRRAQTSPAKVHPRRLGAERQATRPCAPGRRRLRPGRRRAAPPRCPPAGPVRGAGAGALGVELGPRLRGSSRRFA